MKNAVKTGALSEAQLMVLQVVKDEYDENGLNDLRDLLLDFNHRRMQEHLDKTVAEKVYTNADFEKMLKGHDRKGN